MLALRTTPGLVELIVPAAPAVAAALVRAAVSDSAGSDARADIVQWLTRISDRELLVALRNAIVPVLGSRDSDLLYALLKELTQEEVPVILGTLWTRTQQFDSKALQAVIVDRVVRDYPIETRAWLQARVKWSTTVVDLFAATYAPTRHGLLEFLSSDTDLTHSQRGEVLAAFMRAIGRGALPHWFQDVVHSDLSLLLILLEAGESVEVNEQVIRLLDDLRDLPIARSPELIEKVLACRDRPYFGRLLDLTIRSLIVAYVSGEINEAAIRPIQNHVIAVPWFLSVEARDLRSLVTNDTWSSADRWSNAWRWLQQAPSALYAREQSALPVLVDALTRSHHSHWSDEIAIMWAEILRRCASESLGASNRLGLFVQALKFSFDHTSLPLGPVVAQAFPSVYSAITDGQGVPAETDPLFGMFDWDKGKELRRNLVDSFYYSHWRAGDLMMAAGDLSLLRKVFKRLVKKPRGVQYALAAIADLELRADGTAAGLAVELRRMLAQPDFYEEWV